MFDSPSHESKPHDPSPQFPQHGGSMFDSPKPGVVPYAHGGFNSPGFGGSQHSVSNIDNVFADLVHDHDHLGGFDGTSDVRDKAPVSDAGSKAVVPAATPAPVTKPDVEMLDANGVIPPASLAEQPQQKKQEQLPPQTEREKSATMEEFITYEP